MTATPFSSGELALHRYYLWANRMFAHFSGCGQPPQDDAIGRRLWLQQVFAYFALWLSLLYVVAEGWSALGLEDAAVDSLLTSKNRDTLRRFRNGAFHFQESYYDPRFMEFLDAAGESPAWATELHQTIGKWFIRRAGELMPPGEDGVLRRMLTTQHKAHDAKPAPAKKTARPHKEKKA